MSAKPVKLVPQKPLWRRILSATWTSFVTIFLFAEHIYIPYDLYRRSLSNWDQLTKLFSEWPTTGTGAALLGVLGLGYGVYRLWKRAARWWSRTTGSEDKVA